MFSMIFCTSAIAEEINVLAAASLKYVLEDIKSAYVKTHKKDKIHINYISSGKAYAQIQNGAPAHLFIAADVSYPQKLYDKKLAPLPPINYAKGKLVLFSANAAFKVKSIDIRSEFLSSILTSLFPPSFFILFILVLLHTSLNFLVSKIAQ